MSARARTIVHAALGVRNGHATLVSSGAATVTVAGIILPPFAICIGKR